MITHKDIMEDIKRAKQVGDLFLDLFNPKQEHPNPDLEYEAARDLEDEQREQQQAEQVSFK